MPVTATGLKMFSLWEKKNKNKTKKNVEVSGHVTLTDKQVYMGYSCSLKFCTECLIGIL